MYPSNYRYRSNYSGHTAPRSTRSSATLTGPPSKSPRSNSSQTTSGHFSGGRLPIIPFTRSNGRLSNENSSAHTTQPVNRNRDTHFHSTSSSSSSSSFVRSSNNSSKDTSNAHAGQSASSRFNTYLWDVTNTSGDAPRRPERTECSVNARSSYVPPSYDRYIDATRHTRYRKPDATYRKTSMNYNKQDVNYSTPNVRSWREEISKFRSERIMPVLPDLNRKREREAKNIDDLVDRDAERNEPILDTTEPMHINRLPISVFQRIIYEAVPTWQDRIKLGIVCKHWRQYLPYRDARVIAITRKTPKSLLALEAQISHAHPWLTHLSINLPDSDLKPDTLGFLADCHRLTSLELRLSRLDLTWTPLLDRLQFLQIDVSQVLEQAPGAPKVFADTIAALPALKSLIITLRSDYSLQIASPTLAKLRVSCPSLSADEFVYAFQNCPKLDDLSVKSNTLMDIEERLPLQPFLRKLSLDDCRQLTDSDLSAIAAATPGLAEWTVFGCTSLESYAGLQYWTELTTLHMDDVTPSSGLEPEWDLLEEGGMVATNINWEAFYNAMPPLWGLKDFSYMGSAMNDIMLGVLATKCPFLESIYVFNWGAMSISAGGVMFACSMLKCLKKLLIPYSSLGDEIFVILLDEVCNSSDIMLGVLATKCRFLESIYVFNWGAMSISAGGVMFACSMLKCLKKLLIPYSSLGDEIFVILLDEVCNSSDIMLGVLATKCPFLEAIYVFNWGAMSISAGGVMFACSIYAQMSQKASYPILQPG